MIRNGKCQCHQHPIYMYIHAEWDVTEDGEQIVRTLVAEGGKKKLEHEFYRIPIVVQGPLFFYRHHLLNIPLISNHIHKARLSYLRAAVTQYLNDARDELRGEEEEEERREESLYARERED